MEKRKPHYGLAAIKAAFADASRLNRSFVSRQGADALAMDDDAVVAVVQALKRTDFKKSMTSMADHRIWQDVYMPEYGKRALYIPIPTEKLGWVYQTPRLRARGLRCEASETHGKNANS